ncbi:MAG: DUF448 domain-containing protein [Myxococcaceae bacterium]|nr:MAG: DUF448 domain-containing protein [Myxococcaceae bacterium]
MSTPGATNTKHPERTCVACRLRGERDELVRVVVGPEQGLALDPRAVKSGRGAWVHPTKACVATMVKRHAAERSLKIEARRDLDAAALLSELRAAVAQRITSLLLVASRTKVLAIGAEAVDTAVAKGQAHLVLVAKDAGANARSIAEGARKSAPYATKQEFGALLGRGEVSLLAIREARIAAELAATVDRLGTLED